MRRYPRYALYYAPEQGSGLYRFGVRTIGYDAYSGADAAFEPDVVCAHPDWADLTRAPRKYGFHATMKAPFFLRSGVTEDDLRAAVVEFAAKPRVRPVIQPVIRSIESFIAIVPAAPSDALNALAADCVIGFDDFRAPLAVEDRARRKPEALTPSQQKHLDRWGYPYVMDDFRFHMTLTGSLQPGQGETILPVLRQSFSTLKMNSLTIDRIALFKQDSESSRFSIIAAFAFTGDH